MGFRFRKSINIGKGTRINISKSGIGISSGIPGMRIGVGPRGIRNSIGIPGTGLYHVSESGWSSSKKNKALNRIQKSSSLSNPRYVDTLKKQSTGNISIFIILFGVVLITTSLGLILVIIGSLWFIVTHLISRKHKAAKFFNKAISAEKSGLHESVRNYLLKSINFDPENVEAFKFLSIICHDSLHDYVTAAENARKAINLDPYNDIIKLGLADSLFELGEYDEAISILQNINIPEIEEHIAVLLGRCFYEKKMYYVAITQFLRCKLTSRTRTDELLLEARYWIGLSYIKIGDKKKAKTQLSKVFAFDANYRDIKDSMELFETKKN